MPEDLLPRGLHALDGVRLLTLGKSTVTLGGLLFGLVIVAAAFLAARIAGRVFKRLRERSPLAAPSIYIVEKLATYGLIIVGLIMGFSAIGLDLSSLALFAGALGVGLGFGLQGVVKELISGLVLLFDRLVRIGDYLELQTGERGVVAEIGPRATRLRNNDDLDVLVPNSKLIESPVINWTLQNGTRRLHVPFRVAYGVNKEAVRDAVLKAAHDVPFTLDDTPVRRTQVWLVGFGDSALQFELVVWPTLEAVKRPNAANAAYTWAIEDALRAGGFEIPVPQRDLHLREVFGEQGENAKDALRLKTRKKPGAGEEAVAAVSHNDAAEDLARGEDDEILNPTTPPTP
ncbi:small-conductance mechanosensitive channel [Caulobacter ginsengisoli]|uniref:Small-conductance mechanosensitive channel n=1 Tax=Caulobacter ginsengisoli TaxID=400775 RepID=A0ABU0IXL0_9CAUL|nr:mechanosensitive ion channel domain-containing protein [Caulobacter ginsengisoli]MDQ0465928.1 small-conductance mechanosensitive channel [Caulobacter ginsengisoli]